jgi:mannose-6-phosphate isomerase-like protein (cupin superfamily)
MKAEAAVTAAAILLLSAWPGWSQLRDVVKSPEIDKTFASTSHSLAVLTKTNYAVEFRVSSGGQETRKSGPDADEFWFVRRGAAKVVLAGRSHDVNSGDVISVPRTTAYEISPAPGRFEYVAVRIFPSELHNSTISRPGSTRRKKGGLHTGNRTPPKNRSKLAIFQHENHQIPGANQARGYQVHRRPTVD